MKSVKTNICLLIMSLLMSTLFIMASLEGSASANGTGTSKNVIIMIPDGMSVDCSTLARWYKGGTPLNMDEMACGMNRTYSSDAPVADSAPAGSALANGWKSHTGFVGCLPDFATMPGLQPVAEADKRKPVASILEAAKLNGKSTGIIATSEIMHATPADFSAHYPDRKNYDALSKQEVYMNMDVVLGGGYKFLEVNGRKDQSDLVKVIKEKGYDYVNNLAEMRKSTSRKLWGAFAPADMSYEMDRNPAEQPSLAEMTAKALGVLAQNPEGFFLMVEGSKVDWAAHANDPVGVISDVLAFDDAVKVALDFAKQDGNTIVIAVTDHGNGGITIGDSAFSEGYDKQPLGVFIDPLKKASLTGEGLEKKLNTNKTNISEVMSKYFGIDDLTTTEIEAIRAAKTGSLNYVVGPIISKRAHIGWTTNGHTGEDVVFYAYSPNNDCPTGVIENTDVAYYMAKAMGVDLAAVTRELFVPARSAFEAKGATVNWENGDPTNPCIVVTKGADKLELPINTNLARYNHKEINLNGLNIYNGKSTFVPQSAVDLIK